MDTLHLDIANALFSGIVGIGLGYGLKYLTDLGRRVLVRERRVKKVWGFLAEETDVYVPLMDQSNAGAAGGYGDLLALANVITLANRIFGTSAHITVKGAQLDLAAQANRHLIIIGGGKYNQAYLAVIDRLKPPLHFFDTPTHSNNDITNSAGTIRFSPEYSHDGHITADIGLALSASSPFNSAKRVVILAGSHTYGSVAASEFLMSAGFLNRNRQALGKNFVVALRGSVSEHSVNHIEQLSTLTVF